jgi:inner membrane protein
MDPQEKSPFEKFKVWLRNSITFKLFSIGLIILLLLIPSFMVQDLIRERQFTSEDAANEVGSKWGQEQIITGPIVSVPFTSVAKDDKDRLITIKQYAHFLPEKLAVTGDVDTDKRHRGIYEVIVYKSKLKLSGTFSLINPQELNIIPQDIHWNEAFVQIGISDMKGINDNIKIKFNNADYDLNPGIETGDVVSSGVSSRIKIDSATSFNFSFDLNLNGSKQLYFLPLGKETSVVLTSPYTTPKFDGAYISDSNRVTENGFFAQWKILHLNRNYPQKWVSNNYQINESAFGVNFMIAVDHYQKSMRSAKYAVMIIALTFMSFFFVEIINKSRVHPFQYILVGLAICIFYALLLAFSEHIGFNLAYIISALMVLGTVGWYAKFMFENMRTTLLLMGVLVTIYTFIYVIIQLEDFALLVGSLGLFAVLVLTMYLSRKIKFYND